VSICLLELRVSEIALARRGGRRGRRRRREAAVGAVGVEVDFRVSATIPGVDAGPKLGECPVAWLS